MTDDNGKQVKREALYSKALTHPLRISILKVMDQEVWDEEKKKMERRVMSPSELADELDAPLGNTSYHVRQLHAAGMLKLVSEQPRRGAVEHYYRATVRVSFDITPIKTTRRKPVKFKVVIQDADNANMLDEQEVEAPDVGEALALEADLGSLAGYEGSIQVIVSPA